MSLQSPERHPLLPEPEHSSRTSARSCVRRQTSRARAVVGRALAAGLALATCSLSYSAQAQQDSPEAQSGNAAAAPPRALELELGGGAFRRMLRYNDDIFQQLQTYTLKTGPWVEGSAAFYPGALTSEPDPGVVSWFGLGASYGQALGLESERRAGESFETSTRAYSVDLRARVPVKSHRFVISAGYGRRVFSVEDTEPQNALYSAEPGIPNADYQYLRLGVSFEFQAVPTLMLVTSAGYRGVLDQGDIASGSWFPNSSAGGIDFAMQLRYALNQQLDLRVGFELERYFFSLKPELGDANVAGGALDQYLGLQLGVGYAL